MKRITMIVALLTAALMMTAALSACGGSKTDNNTADNTPAETQAEVTEAPQSADITGGTVEWGNYSVLLPEGYELKEASDFSSYDFSVRKSSFNFFDFNTEADDQTMMNHYNYNKQTYTNEQTDVEATYGDNKWTGFQYSDGYGGYGFEAYMTLNGKIVRVSCAGYTFDSAEAKAILASLKTK